MLLETLEGALDEAAAMRAVEGEGPAKGSECPRRRLGEDRRAIAARAPQTLIAYRERLRANVEELLAARWTNPALCRETAIMADRLAIDEELVRLESHIAQLRALTGDPAPAGRRLDFLAQEFNAR